MLQHRLTRGKDFIQLEVDDIYVALTRSRTKVIGLRQDTAYATAKAAQSAFQDQVESFEAEGWKKEPFDPAYKLKSYSPTNFKALLASLDDLTPEELDVLWAKEAQRRWESLQAGTSHTVPAEVVLREAQERIANTERRG